MVSYYLRREVRERMAIARDLALSEDRDWDTIANISAGLEVMFAVSAQNPETNAPEFLYVSNGSWQLTGYWPTELKGKDPAILQGPQTGGTIAHDFMSELKSTGFAETKLVNVRKNGDLYGCHIFACKAPTSQTAPRSEYYGFFSECSLADCQNWPLSHSAPSNSDNQVEAR